MATLSVSVPKQTSTQDRGILFKYRYMPYFILFLMLLAVFAVTVTAYVISFTLSRPQYFVQLEREHNSTNMFCEALPVIDNSHCSRGCDGNNSLAVGKSREFKCNTFFDIYDNDTKDNFQTIVFRCDFPGYWSNFIPQCTKSYFRIVLSCIFILGGISASGATIYKFRSHWRKRIRSQSMLLHLAIKRNDFKRVKKLVPDKTVARKLKTVNDWTALGRAMVLCHKDIVKHLLSVFDASEINSNGPSALYLLLQNAVGQCFEAPEDIIVIIEALLDNGCLVNTPTESFAVAVDKMPVGVCERLLHHGADVNSEHKNGMSSLHLAIKRQSFPLVRLLLSHDVRIKKWKGLSPLEYAIANESEPAIIEHLLEYQRLSLTELTEIICTIRRVARTEGSVLSEFIRLGVSSYIPHLWNERNLTMADTFGVSAIYLLLINSDLRNHIKHTLSKDVSYELAKEWKAWEEFKSFWTHKIPGPLPENVKQHKLGCRDLYAGARLHFENNPESEKEIQQINGCIKTLLSHVSVTFAQHALFKHFRFQWRVGGSVSEGTKVFLPDEFDYVLEIENIEDNNLFVRKTNKSPDHFVLYVSSKQSPWRSYAKNIQINNFSLHLVDAWAFNRAFIDIFDEAISSMTTHTIESLHIPKYSFDRLRKIPCLTLKWFGSIFKELTVTVDVVPAIKIPEDQVQGAKKSQGIDKATDLYIIPEGSDPGNRFFFPISYHSVERNIILSVPDYVRRGYILAKICRISAICFTDPEEEIKLVEKTSTDDVITSYMLKNCLLEVLRENTFEVPDGISDTFSISVKIAELIFMKLEQHLATGIFRRYITQQKRISFIECIHDRDIPYASKRKCCQKRDLALFMCRRVLAFIRDDPDHENGSSIVIQPRSHFIPKKCSPCCFTVFLSEFGENTVLLELIELPFDIHEVDGLRDDEEEGENHALLTDQSNCSTRHHGNHEHESASDEVRIEMHEQ